MSNYLISKQSGSNLFLLEKQKSRFGFGLAFLVFGGVVSALALTQISGISSVGPILGLILGVFVLVAGVVSIIRRGWIRVDQEKRILEFLGGSRKFLFSPKTITFENISLVLVRTSIGHHTSHSILLELKDNSQKLLDNTGSAEYANFLAEEIARRIGCKFQGYAA